MASRSAVSSAAIATPSNAADRGAAGRRAGLSAEHWTLSFQSRFGAKRWLSPATDATLRELPRRGIRAVTVICPGFAADCLETLEEIALLGRETFLKAGGERFDYVPALNDRSDTRRRWRR